MNYDIYLVGARGQGILTIGEILTEAIRQKGMPINFFPSKRMAQRGGFVKTQVRIGRNEAGPNIPEKGADLVIAMELGEAMKAIRFARPGGDFLLFGDRWIPVTGILGKETYPQVENIQEQVRLADARLLYFAYECLPVWKGQLIPSNLFLLGAAMRQTPLGGLVRREAVIEAIRRRWEKSFQPNRFAFESRYTTAF